MHQLAGGGATIEGAGVSLFDNHDAGSLNALVTGVNRGGDEVGEAHVGDEASALLDVEHRLFAIFPFRDAGLAAQHAGIDPDIRNRFGETERATLHFAVFPGLRGNGQRHVMQDLLGSAALVNGGEG